jgi:segregation and condensation protein A
MSTDLAPEAATAGFTGAEGDVAGAEPVEGRFNVRLAEFEGPFDLLLTLIGKHKLEVTELALHQVTDDFLGYIREQGIEWDLDEASAFLVVAATLLDLKAARLLPSGEVEDDEDIARLEARDLLFARLLQYRAYKEAAAWLKDRYATQGHTFPRAVALEPAFASLLPEVLLAITPEAFAQLAAKAMIPKPVALVGTTHIHAPAVSVREQAAVLVDRLRRVRSASFRSLVADAGSTLVVVARFLAVLELFREGSVAVEQAAPLGDFFVRWTGSEDGDVEVDAEFDEEDPREPR